MIFDSQFHGISWKFLAILVPAVTIAAIVFLLIYAFAKFESSEENLKDKIEEISQVHSLAVAHPLWTLDFDGLERSIQTIALHPEIVCVEVLEFSEQLSYYWPENCSQPDDDKVLQTELVFENHRVGKLNLFYTRAPFTAALKREVLIGALFFFLLVSVVAVVAFAALQLIVGRPVQRLITSIRNAELGGKREPVRWLSQDELGSVITAYNRMLQQVDENTNELIAAREQAESAAYTKSRFLANMSHELRTPLNAVIGITEMLREEAEDENEDTEPYDRVAGSGRHLLRLIDDILDFSKIEAGKLEITCEKVSLDDLLQEVMDTTQPLAAKRQNELKLVYTGEPAYIDTDPFRLRQIIFNLLSNACKFTENGVVSLIVREESFAEQNRVLFSVRDNGIGISKDQIDHLFEDFSQADISTTRQYGGTGLGLAISQRLCKLLGGQIKLESEFGVGSDFSFILPQQSNTGLPSQSKNLWRYSM